MKKIVSLSILMLAAWGGAFAQTSGAIVTTIPSSFTAEDQVKIIVDVSKVGNLAGLEPLYIWTWEPSDAAPGNGAWENSNEARKMVKEGPDRWSWTITPTTFYGKSPAEITQIAFLVKAKDGNGDKKTEDIRLAVSPLVYVPTAFRTFPKVIGQNEVVTFYLDQSLATDLTTQRMRPTHARVWLYEGSDSVDVSKVVTLSKQSDRIHYHTFYPPKLFAIPPGKIVTRLRVVFLGKGKDANGNDVDVESPPFDYGFDELK